MADQHGHRLILIDHGGELYQRVLTLRDELLRRPLGLSFTEGDLAAEASHRHYALMASDSPIACVVAEPTGNARYRLRQMAVSPGRQRQGVGRRLVELVEEDLVAVGARELILHARDHAIGFYNKLGYAAYGEPFVEVGIPHQAMRKRLTMTLLTPFHLAVQVHDLSAAREFYGGLLGCPEGRSSDRWIDFDLFGHQFVCHENVDLEVKHHRCGVDGHAVPTPHFGVVLEMDRWKELADRVRAAGVDFIVEPYLRFEGQPGEQATMFFSDPSGNALEFKAFRDIEGQLFAK